MVALPKGPVLNNDTRYHYERESNNLTIKDYFDPRKIDTNILKLPRKVMYEPLFVCDQLLITFGKPSKLIIFDDTSHIDAIYNYYHDINNLYS